MKSISMPADDRARGAALVPPPQLDIFHGADGHGSGGPHRPPTDDSLEELTRAMTINALGGDRAILLASHGSRSPIWRSMLLDVHDQAARELLTLPGVGQVRSAFMEYTEPSIATQLRAFDMAGISSVLVIPLLLTISDHSFDDIPAICGHTSDPDRLAQLQKDRIEVYPAQAELTFAPLLDFSGLVRTNLAHRIRSMLERAPRDVGTTGLVLVGYGSAEYDDEWTRFFRETGAVAEADLGLAASSHAWCGHLVNYRREPTIEAIDAMLERTDRVLVVPLFVAYDPMFHERIIGRAVSECADPTRVLYSGDAILPEPEVGRWAVRIARSMLDSPDPPSPAAA